MIGEFTLDGKQSASTVGSVEVYRDIEIDTAEVVIFFTSRCTECSWPGSTHSNDEFEPPKAAKQALAAMEVDARAHMDSAHATAGVR